MDSGVVFALVLAVLFLGSLVWLVVYARRQEKKDASKISDKPDSHQKNRVT